MSPEYEKAVEPFQFKGSIKDASKPSIEDQFPILTECYCYKCGYKNIRCQGGEGDYYVGPSYYCPACELVFTMG